MLFLFDLRQNTLHRRPSVYYYSFSPEATNHRRLVRYTFCFFFALSAFTLAQRHFFEESSASEYLLIFRHTFGLLLFFSFLLLFVEPEFFSCAIYPHFLFLLTYNGWARIRGHFAFLLAERSCCGCFCYYEVGKHDGWVGWLVGGLAGGKGEGGEIREKT